MSVSRDLVDDAWHRGVEEVVGPTRSTKASDVRTSGDALGPRVAARTSVRNSTDTDRKQLANTISIVVSTTRARQYKSLLDRLCGQPLLSDELIQSAVDAVARSMGTDVATLYAYDRRAGQLVLVATHGLNRSSIGYVTLESGQGMSGQALSTGQPFLRADVREEGSSFPIPAFDRGRYRSLLAIPVTLNSVCVGVLNVQTTDIRHYQPRDIEELSEIAELLAPVLDALWRGDLAARIRGPGAVARIDGLLSGRYYRADVAERLAEQLHIVFPVRRSTVGLFRPDGSMEMFGDAPDAQAEDVLRRSATECADATDPLTDESGGIFVPLRVGADNLGAFYLALGDGYPTPISSAASRLLGTLAEQVSNALRSSELDALDMGARIREAAPQELIQLVLDGAGLDSLLQRSAELCRGAIAITDRLGALVAGTLPRIVGLNVPLSVEGVELGRMLVSNEAESAPVLSTVVQAAALELSKWKVRFDIERELRGDALDSLLAVQSDPRETEARARLIGIDSSRDYIPVLFEFDVEGIAEKRGSLGLRSMLATIQRTFGPAPESVSFARSDGVLVLIDEATLPRGASRPVADALADLRVTAAGTPVSAGIGPAGKPSAEYGQTLREARLAADLGLRFGAAGPIDATQLGTYRLLLGVDDRRRLQEFVDKYLGVLVEHDSRQGTQFVRTLEAFHAHGENPRLAARELFVHANTLKYRLGRIEELTGHDVRRTSDRLNVYLALYGLRFLEPERQSLLPNDFAALPPPSEQETSVRGASGLP